MILKLQQKLSKDANLKELISGSILTFFVKITGILLSYFIIMLISRDYGSEGAGIYGLTVSVLDSLAILGGLGLNIAVLRYVGQFTKTKNGIANMKRLYNYILQMAMPFGLVVGLVLFLSAETISTSLFQNKKYVTALRVAAFAVPFLTLTLINIEFIRGLKFLKISEYLRSINRQVIITLVLVLPVFSFGLFDAIYALVLGIILSFTFSIVFIVRYLGRNHVTSSNIEFTRKELFHTSLPMMVTSIASFILSNAGAVFLEIYSSTSDVGIFNVCLRLAQLVSLVLIVVNTISAPKFAELFWAKKIDQLQKVIRQSSKIIFFISLFISLGLIVFSDLALGMFGEEFKKGSLVLAILIIGQMVNAISGSVGIFLNMSGNQKLLRNIISITVFLALLGYILLVPRFGILGAAITTMFSAIFLNVVCVMETSRQLQIRTYYLPFIK